MAVKGSFKRELRLLFFVLGIPSIVAIKVEHVMMAGTMFCQKDVRMPGQFSLEWDKDDVFDVDLQKKETVYHAPNIQKFAYYEAQGGLQNMAVCKHNLDVYIQTNSTPGPTEGELPSPDPETTETVVCALGLAVGILGIVIGTILVIKGMKQSDLQRRQMR